MKPIVVKEKNGQILITQEEFEQILNDVYEEGKKDGSNTNSHYCNWYLCPYRNRNTWDWTKVTYKTTTDAISVPIMTTDTVGYVPLNANTSDSSCTNKLKTTIHWAKHKENK